MLPKIAKQRVTLEGLLGGPGTLGGGNSKYMRKNYWKVGNEVATEELIQEVSRERR